MQRVVKRVVSGAVWAVTAVTLVACDQIDTTKHSEGYSTFGAVVYREACQREAYIGQLAQKEAGQIDTVDVSGSLGRSVCVDGMPAPSTSPEKLKAIVQQKLDLVATIDSVLPKPILSDLESYLEAILPLTDDDTLPNAIASLSGLLTTMQKDAGFAPALARLASRVGYRPTKTAAGLVHAILEYPAIDDFLGKVLGMIAQGGTAEVEWKHIQSALSYEMRSAKSVPDPKDPQRTLRLALDLMLTTNPDLSSGMPRPMVVRDYRGMATATTINGKVQAPFVDLDNDGLADIDTAGRYVDAMGKVLVVAPPFPEAGATDTAPRNTQGQALTATGSTSTLYRYLDLDPTVIAGLTREATTLLDAKKDITLGLVHGMSALLGPTATQTKIYTDSLGGMIGTLTYDGYDTKQSAILDLLHAFVQILGDPNARDVLATTRTLLSKYESQTTRAIGAMLDAKDLGKKFPNAVIPEQSTLYDDLAPIIIRILRVPGLADDLLVAMTNPHVKGLTPMISRLMTFRTQIDFDHTDGPDFPLANTIEGDPAGTVDRTKVDSDYNRSLMQRIAHMVHDANGARFCNKDNAQIKILGLSLATYAECELFEIDDLGLFFVLNMTSDSIRKDASRYATTYSKASFREQITSSTVRGITPDSGLGDGILQTLVGITGFTRFPSPAAATRSLYLRYNEQSSFLQNTTSPVLTKDGDKFIDIHDKSIFAWEETLATNPSGFTNDTFYDAVRPLVDAFAKHDECLSFDNTTGNCTTTQNAAKIFVDLLGMLHEHWGSPKSTFFGHTFQATNKAQPHFARLDNVVSYETLMAQVLGSSDLVPAIIDLAPVLNTMTIDGTVGGQPARPVLLSAARYVFDPKAAPMGMTYRDGTTATATSDGKTVIPRASLYYMMADAFAGKRAALAAVPTAQADNWRNSTSAMIDQMLTVEKTTTGYRLKNRRMHAITLVLVDFLRSRLAAHATSADADTWVHQTLTQDLTDILGGPTFASMAAFVAKVQADPDARDQLYGLLSYLVNEASNDLVFQTALTTLADQLQGFQPDDDLLPIARVLGAALDPAQGTVDTQLTLVKKSRDLDQKKILLTVLRNLYKPNTDLTYPAGKLSDILSELNRMQPGQGGQLGAEDYRSIFGEISNFLSDEKRGLTRFTNIVKSRKPN